MKNRLKPITTEELNRFKSLVSKCGYIHPLKEEYKKLGRKILKYIAQEMGLNSGEYEIRWNPGGIAVSGDHTLHTSKVYLALHDNLGSGWFYYRSCNGLRDYSGGQNQIVYWNKLQNLDQLIKALKIMQAGGYEDNGDFIMTKGMVERKAISHFNPVGYPVFS